MPMKQNRIVSGAIPKYRQLLHILRKQILAGQLLPGERLPTEEELSQTYVLSRGTVRRAVAQLEAEKLIRIEHGVGSFVRDQHPNAIPFRFAAEHEIRASQNGNVRFVVLAQEVVEANIEIAERLRLSPNAPVIHIARLKLVDDQPVAYSERYLPESLAPGLETADLSTGAIHEQLIDRSALPLLRAEIEIEAHFLNEDEASLLKVEPGVRAIFVRRLTYTAPNRPAVWFHAWYVDSYTMQVLVDERSNDLF